MLANALALAALCAAVAHAGADTITRPDSILYLSTDFLSFLHNAEFHNEFREGETILGSIVNGRVAVKATPRMSFSLGLHLRKQYGDERFLSDIRPLFQACYRQQAFSLILGEVLFTPTRHGLPDGLLREEFTYDPGVEEGVQVLYLGTTVSQDLWLTFSALNTEDHREHLSGGNCTRIRLGPVCLSAMAYIDHYGGEAFAPAGDPVRENAAGAGGVTFTHAIERVVEELGAEQFVLGSYTARDRSHDDPYESGWGSLSRGWVKVLGFLCRFSYFQGHDYVAWNGNALYQSNEPYYSLHVSKRMAFPGKVFLEFGGRLEFVGIGPAEYGSRGEHVIWLQMGMDFRRLLIPGSLAEF
ncbi:MAG: hypothetical protein GF418_12075 [Chitinivibrionales bacterium]|nr:hypothetical protein [Chitinivibrionales bacterium]MBD3396355.1 hypothetical protein [Chitinivibrionales bacterium]